LGSDKIRLKGDAHDDTTEVTQAEQIIKQRREAETMMVYLGSRFTLISLQNTRLLCRSVRNYSVYRGAEFIDSVSLSLRALSG